jgi:simple sugar transport system ATP-binding protein
MEGITKFYPTSGVLANDGAVLEVSDLEIHAVMGENGAGKTTLMKILYGLERPDSGRILLDGRAVRLAGPAAATALGIGMVQQHAEVVGGFSVAANVTLCAEPRRLGLFFDRKRAERETGALIEANGFHLDPAAPASSLSVGELQELEILKLLYRKAGLLVLDEPTALLADQEVEGLFATLRRLRAAGKTIIIITHKVAEVLRLADTVTVMRAGRTLVRLPVAGLDEGGLAALMMGKDGDGTASLGPSCAPAGDVVGMAGGAKAEGGQRPPVVFEMRNVSLARKRRARPAVSGLNIEIRSGEVLGLCGLAGNGLDEVENLASGFVRATGGAVLLHGLPLPRRRLPGQGYVPSDRLFRGSSLNSAVADNLAALDREAWFPHGLVDRRRLAAFSEGAIARFGISARPTQRLGTLSGGNIQKVVLARELASTAGAVPAAEACEDGKPRPEPAFLLFCNPTHGLDLASSAFVHARLLEAKAAGAAVLLVSSNLDEVLGLSDRVGILSRGRLALEVANGPLVDRAALEEAMLGLGTDAAAPRTFKDASLAAGRGT